MEKLTISILHSPIHTTIVASPTLLPQFIYFFVGAVRSLVVDWLMGINRCRRTGKLFNSRKQRLDGWYMAVSFPPHPKLHTAIFQKHSGGRHSILNSNKVAHFCEYQSQHKPNHNQLSTLNKSTSIFNYVHYRPHENLVLKLGPLNACVT